jgi:hypothetical protein
MAVRRVRRIIRRFDPWTVLKVSVIFNAIATMVFILGFWVVWSLILQRGIPELLVNLLDAVNVDFEFQGDVYFRIVVFIGIVFGAGMTAAMTLGAIVYNLIADLVGGIELTVLEETYQTKAMPGATEVPVRKPRRPLLSQIMPPSRTATPVRQATTPAAPPVAPPVAPPRKPAAATPSATEEAPAESAARVANTG